MVQKCGECMCVGKPLANLPPHLVPTVWGVPQDLLQRYVDVNADGSLIVGGEKSLQVCMYVFTAIQTYLRVIANLQLVYVVELCTCSMCMVGGVHQQTGGSYRVSVHRQTWSEQYSCV